MADRNQQYWQDKNGEEWPVPTGRALKFEFPAHRALRAHVFARDNFTCKHCGIKPKKIPKNYDGESSVRISFLPKLTVLELDHILPRKLRGTHHPYNLQTLCNRCNAKKGCST